MLTFISEFLLCFASCFSRPAAFDWFRIVVMGFLVRSDSLGMTSFLRDLALKPSLYPCLEHFFRADSWNWESLFETWAALIADKAPLKRLSGRVVLIGDGVKQAKDGRYLPCVKKMVQESETASKPKYLYGHLFGAVGILIGNTTKVFCLPLSIQLHDGNQALHQWKGETEEISHVVQMIRDGFRAARQVGRCLFVLDRYFLTVPLLKEWNELSTDCSGLLSVVTRAKGNVVAYEFPGPYPGKGRPRKRGAAVHLKELFQSEAAAFQEANLWMYGVKKQVRFLSRTYLWGQKLYQELQFVLVEYDGKQVILASTDQSMKAEDIITAYAYRFKIEAMFRELKQQFGGFCYHFWSKAVPKRKRYQKTGSPDPLLSVSGEKEQKRIRQACKATEGYLLFASIAMGITQLLCLKQEGVLEVSEYRYLRTPSRSVMSEASMIEYLRRNLFRFLAEQDQLTITKIITSRQISPGKQGF